jgi:very-short-patch-repair endonuclease
MELKDKILDELRKGKPLKAKDITRSLGNDVTTQMVNSILHGELKKGLVIQNSKYEWTLKSGSAPKVPNTEVPREKANTDLCKLAGYYMDCIAKDLDSGVEVWASNKYGKPDYFQINKLNLEEQQDYDKASGEHIVNKLVRNKNALNVILGYPIYLHEITNKDGHKYYKVKPVLIQKIDKESFLSGKIEIIDDAPIINPEVVTNQEGSPPFELMQDIMALNQELGLDNGDLPLLDEIASRLQMIRSNWNWNSNLASEALSDVDLSSCNKSGIYNCAGIFLSEGSKYTVGLEQELKELQYIQNDDLKDSILGKLIRGELNPTQLQEKVLLEPLPMNEEQRDAIIRGLQSDLTVVTGPPGTGKSQVVSNLIVNAVYDGQKVLFASRNNKAVDVVLERVNGLSKDPVMLRLGGTDKQGNLSKYLTNILSTNVNAEDQNLFNETHRRHVRMIEQVEKIRKQHEELVNLRNRVDFLEQEVEHLRTDLDSGLFDLFKSYTLEDIKRLTNFRSSLNDSINLTDPGNWTLWERIRGLANPKKHIPPLKELIHENLSLMDKLGLERPVINDTDVLTVARDILKNLAERTSACEKISEYFESLANLGKTKSVFDLTTKEKELISEISVNSRNLWHLWLKLLPSRMKQEERKIVGDYLAVLDLIVKANSNNANVPKGIWAKYYSLLPKITNILSCWAVTALSVKGKVPFIPGFFDLLIIDEASQCDIASVLPLLYRAKRAVIIGDDKQLTFITKIRTSEDHQLIEQHGITNDFMNWSYSATSVFRLCATLCHGENIVELKDHHRSHADIIGYANKYFYNGNLRIATNYSNLNGLPGEPAVRWIDVKGKVAKPAIGGALNEVEALKVVEELRRLVRAGYQGSIGVVSPFRAQATRIRDIVSGDRDLEERLETRKFLVDTVHKFQGDERDIMLFSTVVSDGIAKGPEEFLKRTGNLFNVAVTRARAGLIVVGDRAACVNSAVDHFSKFAEHAAAISDNARRNTDYLVTDFGPQYPALTGTDIVSDWEKILYTALYKKGIKTHPQYKIDKYSLDMALIMGERKLDIEVDGETYHRDWNGELLRRDKIRNKRMIELGWDVQRFWVYEIRDNMAGCIARIEDWINKAAAGT